MKWSECFIPTRREVPDDAEIPSHVLMVRAALIRMLHAGHYIYLPLGYRSLRKAEEIVREEMNRAGAIEVHMPAMHEATLWARTGREEAMGKVLFHLEDRHGKMNVLGPTHEETFTWMVAREVQTYRQLPMTLYQIQTKFRDEERPRFGVLRTREFVMKDAYSFDTDQESLDKSYQAMYDAYCRVFDRCGLDYVICEADPGVMGGSVNHEFMVPTPNGEDSVAICGGCDYRANIDRCECAVPDPMDPPSGVSDPEEIETPNRRTIEEVSRFLKCEPSVLLKTLIYEDDDGPFAVVIRGDHELNEHKLARVRGGAVRPAEPQTVKDVTKAPIGFAGPVGLDLKIYADPAIQSVGTDGITGANKGDMHLKGVAPGVHFSPEYADLRVAVHGDACPRCGSEITVTDAVEVGHVFKLGTKYSESLEANFTAENGEETVMQMGCYGIGVNRILVAALEQRANGGAGHDDDGVVWHPNIAPYQVTVISLNPNEEDVAKIAEEIHDALEAKGIDVLYDDRDERAGVKFKDADLIGMPVRVVVGGRSLKDGVVEVRTRAAGRDKEATRKVAPAEAVATAEALLEELLKI